MARHTNRQRYVLLLLLLTSITFITLDQRGDGDAFINPVRNAARDAVAPMDRASGDALAPVTDWLRGVFEAGKLERDNANLRRDLAAMKGQVAASQDALRQNKELSALNDLSFVGTLAGTTARVINGSPGSFENTVLLDRGTADGVAIDNPVVTRGGLVGRVEAVSEHTATIALITDSSSGVGVRLVKTDATGVAQGITGRRTLRLDFVDVDARVARGENAVTSGLQLARFPAGIPVGTVTKVDKRPGRLQQDIQLTPLADLDHLEFVRVLRWEPTRLRSGA